jgi:hypothetical protein
VAPIPEARISPEVSLTKAAEMLFGVAPGSRTHTLPLPMTSGMKEEKYSP